MTIEIIYKRSIIGQEFAESDFDRARQGLAQRFPSFEIISFEFSEEQMSFLLKCSLPADEELKSL